MQMNRDTAICRAKDSREAFGLPARRGIRLVARKQRRAGAILELIIVLPILIGLSFGLADFGYFFFVKNTIQGAAQAGARAGIPVGAVNSNVTTAVTNMMSASGFSSSQYSTTITDLSGNAVDLSTTGSGVAFKVTVSASWGTIGLHCLSPYFGGISNSKSVTGVSAMVTE
jgi:Flp pilus assembly protein TadG